MIGYAEIELVVVVAITAACAWSVWQRVKPKPQNTVAVKSHSGCGSCRQCPGQRCAPTKTD